jgi:hypothetical protein
MGAVFAGTLFYDGQGFMVKKASKITKAAQLNGATVCVQPGTTTELNLSDYFRTKKMTFKPVVIAELNQIEQAFFAGRCDVYTTDISGLAATRLKAPNKDDYVMLPEAISKEPLGPMIRRGDWEFFTIVRWVLFGLIEAEEYGVTQANVDKLKAESKEPPDPASGRHLRRRRQGHGPGQRLAGARAQGGRQLRRDVRAQHRPAGPRARPERAVEGRRPDVRAADPLIARADCTAPIALGPPRRPPIARPPGDAHVRQRTTTRHPLPGAAAGASSAWAGTWCRTRCTTWRRARSRSGSASSGRRPASRSPRSTSPTSVRLLRARVPRRHGQHAAGGGAGHRRRDRVRHAARHRAPVENWLVARLASAYVEVMRNVPLLLQLFVWYGLFTELLPGGARGDRRRRLAVRQPARLPLRLAGRRTGLGGLRLGAAGRRGARGSRGRALQRRVIRRPPACSRPVWPALAPR